MKSSMIMSSMLVCAFLLNGCTTARMGVNGDSSVYVSRSRWSVLTINNWTEGQILADATVTKDIYCGEGKSEGIVENPVLRDKGKEEPKTNMGFWEGLVSLFDILPDCKINLFSMERYMKVDSQPSVKSE